MSLLLAQAPIAWYVVRASRLVAFGALTLSVWLGLATSTRLLGPRRMRSLVGWHQTIAWTGVSMLGLHAGALLDPVRCATFTVGGQSLPAPLPAANPERRTVGSVHPKGAIVYRIEIDRTLCSGFGICAELAPAVVDVGKDGIATVRTSVTADPSVLEAAAACPMAAITVVEGKAA